MNIITFAPQPPPRHPPMTAAPTAATPTSTTRNWPEILPFHSSQELTKATWFLNITKKSHQAFLSPGKPPWATPTGPTMSQPSHSQLKQLAHKRKDSATKKNDSSSTKKSRKWRRPRCAETFSCTKTASMAMPALMLTTTMNLCQKHISHPTTKQRCAANTRMKATACTDKDANSFTASTTSETNPSLPTKEV